ncbi:MAG: EAL domain-containing protein [Gammaproteobacteria bacterium]|nr:EAL domain-containing protein [Gammaproteobacteria bacterium]
MHENQDNNKQATGQGSRQDGSGYREQRSMNRWQYRADQVQLRQQQVQSEMSASVQVAAIVVAVFWNYAPHALMLGWAFAVVATVGIRSLFISASNSLERRDDVDVWGKQYIMGSFLSGACWGSFGILSVIYSDLMHQLFAMALLVGMCLTAFASMQFSPRTLLAFVIPALLPITAWFIYTGGSMQYAMAGLNAIFIYVMLGASHAIRKVQANTIGLGLHNTELITNLIKTRETAEEAQKYAERVNLQLQEQMEERQLAEERIRASEQRMSAIFESMQDTIYQTDLDGIIQWVTPSIRQLLGYDAHEMVGRSIKEFYLVSGDHGELKHALNINNGRLQHFETRLVHKDGTHIWISENSHYRYDTAANPVGIEGTIRDTSALNLAREALQKEKDRAQVTLGSIGDGVITTDMNGNIEYMNTIAEQSTGWKLSDARGRSMIKVFKLVDEKSQEEPPNPASQCLEYGKSIMLAGHLLLIHRYREQHMSVEVNASPILDGNGDITGVVLVFHDVTELRGLAKKMSYQATHDSLTGLLNRREFENRLKLAINDARQENNRHALCYLDLDNFKVVNDTSGHIAGDELLKQLTIKLRIELREADTLARLGGDEFGILLEGCSIENATELAESLRSIVEDFRFVWDNNFFRIGVSIGLVPIDQDCGTLSDILSAADSACYIAKEQGRNRVHIYEPNDEAVAERHGQMQWVQRIQNVLEEDRFRLFFQPIAKLSRDANEESTTHGEVLIRMLDDNNRIVGPGSFISSAERYQLMPAIDRWVVSNTFRMLTLDKQHIKDHVSACCINLSGQSLSDERFMEFLVSEIRESGVSPELLCFEITETAVIANLCNASSLISKLRAMGCRFALDDFGVGLSSFGYLKNLAVDYLKLDGCFVKNMVHDRIDLAMVEAINQIGHSMDIKTIAEFVEDEATLEAVRKIGIDYAQGYEIAKPVPIEIGLYGKPIDYRQANAAEIKVVSNS